MIVINYRSLIFILVFIFFSCDRDVKVEESYQILNLLIRDFEEISILHPSFAPPPSGSYIYTKNDSLRKYKYFYDQYLNRKNIVISNNFFEIDRKKLQNTNSCNAFYNVNEFKFYENSKKLELKYLNSIKSNIIKIPNSKEIDVKLSFSKILFNKSNNRAILIFVVKFNDLNSFSSIVYLEKEFFLWKIKCEKILTIS